MLDLQEHKTSNKKFSSFLQKPLDLSKKALSLHNAMRKQSAKT